MRTSAHARGKRDAPEAGESLRECGKHVRRSAPSRGATTGETDSVDTALVH